MPQYMLLIYPPVDTPPPGRLERWQAFTDALKDDGALIANGRLQDVHSATCVRTQAGETLISDGPFAETKEQLLGFYVLDCADDDAAVEAARELRRANPSALYEIRPIMLYLPGQAIPQTEAAGVTRPNQI